MGCDPYAFVDIPEEDYIIKAAMLKEALELRYNELETLSVLIAQKLMA